ncbi:MAG: hypothetical protein PHW04_01990 [Candidatus Wallbacteria bacterium]|nr:hypothetical protein [Candidatus Wallbacteria bacterium]
MKAILLLIIGAALFVISGCGGGGGGGGGGGTTPPANTVTSGWSYLNGANYSSATSTFNAVLQNQESTAADKASARSGLGWIDLREDGVSLVTDETIAKFTTALTEDAANKEAMIGLAMIYLTRTGNQEVGYLESAGLSDVNYVFSSKLSLSNAEAHSLMALAYFENGQTVPAQAQIDKANALEGGANKTIQQVYNSLDKLGL